MCLVGVCVLCIVWGWYVNGVVNFINICFVDVFVVEVGNVCFICFNVYFLLRKFWFGVGIFEGVYDVWCYFCNDVFYRNVFLDCKVFWLNCGVVCNGFVGVCKGVVFS